MDKLSPEHQLLILIGREAGRTQKLKMLNHYKNSKKLKNIFLYSLDPFKKYFIKEIPDTVKGQGEGIIDEFTWSVLDRLSARTVTGADAKLLLFGHMRDLTSTEAMLLQKIVLHKLDIGVAFKTANQIWSKLIVDRFVQKAEDYDTDQLVLPSYAGLKVDGTRADYKDGVFTARSGHAITGLQRIHKDIVAKGGGHWDGELTVPKFGRDFDRASGYLRSNIDDKVDARYVVFDNLS